MKKFILNSGFLILLIGVTISGCTRSSNDLFKQKDESVKGIDNTINNIREKNLIAEKAIIENKKFISDNSEFKKKKNFVNRKDVKKDDVTEKTEDSPVINRKPRDPRVADDSDMQRGSFDFREYKKRMGYDDKTQIDEYVDESKLKKSE